MRVEPEKPIKLPGGSLTGPDKIATSGSAAYLSGKETL